MSKTITNISQYLQSVQKEIQQNIISTGKEATGDTRNSVKVFTQESKTGIQAADHIGNLETGTPPNSGVTIPEIKRWATAKPVFTENVSRFAFFTTKRIEAVGSLQFIMNKFDNIFSKEIRDAIPEINKIAVDTVNTEIADIVK